MSVGIHVLHMPVEVRGQLLGVSSLLVGIWQFGLSVRLTRLNVLPAKLPHLYKRLPCPLFLFYSFLFCSVLFCSPLLFFLFVDTLKIFNHTVWEDLDGFASKFGWVWVEISGWDISCYLSVWHVVPEKYLFNKEHWVWISTGRVVV